MTDTELRTFCSRFLDAIERQDFDTLTSVYHPDLRFRVNLAGAAISVRTP